MPRGILIHSRFKPASQLLHTLGRQPAGLLSNTIPYSRRAETFFVSYFEFGTNLHPFINVNTIIEAD